MWKNSRSKGQWEWPSKRKSDWTDKTHFLLVNYSYWEPYFLPSFLLLSDKDAAGRERSCSQIKILHEDRCCKQVEKLNKRRCSIRQSSVRRCSIRQSSVRRCSIHKTEKLNKEMLHQTEKLNKMLNDKDATEGRSPGTARPFKGWSHVMLLQLQFGSKRQPHLVTSLLTAQSLLIVILGLRSNAAALPGVMSL